MEGITKKSGYSDFRRIVMARWCSASTEEKVRKNEMLSFV